MRSTLNVRFILELSCVIAIVTVAVDGNDTSQTPVKKGDNTIIVNVNQDSQTKEAIKSLETTLEKNFQQLIRVVNGTSHGILRIAVLFAFFIQSFAYRLT